MALVEGASHGILFPDREVQVAPGRLDDLLGEPLEDPPSRAAELLGVENLVEHDTANRNLDSTHAGALLVLLVGDDHAILPDDLARLDHAPELVLPDMREDVFAPLEVPVDFLQVGDRRVLHGFFLKTRIGSYLWLSSLRVPIIALSISRADCS